MKFKYYLNYNPIQFKAKLFYVIYLSRNYILPLYYSVLTKTIETHHLLALTSIISCGDYECVSLLMGDNSFELGALNENFCYKRTART